MPKVTVLMPSLNVSAYIDQCMESVVSQTLHDIEIICIDAGSTDGTMDKLKKYSSMDKRIHLIYSDKKSYGYQLNLGIKAASGKYIGIVETDDIVEPDMFETLYNTAIKTEAEFVKGNYEQFIETKNGLRWYKRSTIPIKGSDMVGQIINPKQLPKLFVNDGYLWRGIYKSDLIKKVLLNESQGAAYQDIGFLYQIYSSASRAVYIDKVVYLYRQDNTNSSTFNTNGFHYMVNEYTYVEQFTKDKNREWKSIYYQKMLSQCIRRFQIMALSGRVWNEAKPDIERLRDCLSNAVNVGLLRVDDVDEHMWKLLELFLDDWKKVYFYYNSKFQQKLNILKNILRIIGNRKTVIFCCTEYGRFFHLLLEYKIPQTVIAYCDNNSKLWGTIEQGLAVMSPKDAVEKYSKAVFVIANQKSSDSIKKQLIELGIKEDNICVFAEKPDRIMFYF
jgi:glycosyltransferase involved in cell wall biosynthesis